MRKALYISAAVVGLLVATLFASSIFQVYQGGTGKNTLTAHAVLLGEGTAAVSSLTIGAHQVAVGAASADPSAKTLPDCQDTGGNHLNFAQSTDAFSCGTSSSGGGGGGSTGFFGLWSFTAPPSAGWTWDNQGSSTIDSTSGYEYASLTRASAVQMRLRYRTAPATPYTITTAILADFSGSVSATGTAQEAGIAIGFRDSTGKLEQLLILLSASTPDIAVDTWASSTSLTATPCVYGSAVGIGQFIYRQPLLMQISDDGTNLKFRLSIDGNHWPTAFCSVSRTAQFASGPTQVYYGAYVNGDAVEVALVHWVATSP